MSEEIDELSVAMPILIFPVERDMRTVTKILGIVLIITFIVAIFTANIIKFYQRTVTEEAMPAKESQMGSWAGVINLVYLLVMVVLITLFMIWVIKKGKIGFFRALMTVLMVYLIFVFTPFMVSLYVVYFAIILYESGVAISTVLLYYIVYLLAYGSMIIFSAFYVLSVIKRRYFYLRNAILILVGVWTAVWLSWNFGEITPIFVLIGFSLYDLYSVFRGPLRELSNVLTEREKQMFKDSSKGIMLGLGDIFFYSFTIGYSFAFLQLTEVLAIMAVLFVGVLATIFILLKYSIDALPALPIPIIAAVILIVVFRFVC